MTYVDKDKLPYIFAKAINEFDGTFIPISEVAIKVGQIILNLPTANVAEVKRGEWIECSNELNKYCSVCKKVDGTIYEKPPFCKNCGAKMDGGKAE